MEVGVAFEFIANKRLHSLQVFLVESLSHQIQDKETLLVADGTELESFGHIEHRLNHFLTKNCAQAGRFADRSAL